MWLDEAQIGLMLETSLVHPHTIVSMLINDLAGMRAAVPVKVTDHQCRPRRR
jgi:hypothetical protein